MTKEENGEHPTDRELLPMRPADGGVEPMVYQLRIKSSSAGGTVITIHLAGNPISVNSSRVPGLASVGRGAIMGARCLGIALAISFFLWGGAFLLVKTSIQLSEQAYAIAGWQTRMLN